MSARVCMVVANAVAGDSRVQKIAWTASEAGWECVLVGVERRGRASEGSIGRCRVIITAPDVPPAVLFQARRVWRGIRRRMMRVTAEPHTSQGTVDAVRRRLWRLLVGKADVRRTLPELQELGDAMVPAIVAARPDVIHAHDYTSFVAVLPAIEQLAAQGARPRVVYDAHEFLPGVLGHGPVWAATMRALERAGIRAADAVITVSEPLADLLRVEHALTVPVTVVTNAPVVEERTGDGPADIREAVGVPASTPLLVYSGGVAPQRGLDTAVRALPTLDGVHLALLSTRNRHVEALLALAARLGVADRVHVLPYVPPGEVAAFLRGASAGIVTSLHHPNHEISLPTKYFEYAQAHLPVVVSDLAEVARRTRDLGNGVVYTAGDASDFVEAVTAVLAESERMTAAYSPQVLEEFNWVGQESTLLGVYTSLTGLVPTPAGSGRPFEECALTMVGAAVQNGLTRTGQRG